jgi:hypothetical protein
MVTCTSDRLPPCHQGAPLVWAVLRAVLVLAGVPVSLRPHVPGENPWATPEQRRKAPGEARDDARND